MKCSIYFYFLLAIRLGGDFGSGSGSKLNCATRVGSDDLGYGPGSGFSLKPVQTSSSDVRTGLKPAESFMFKEVYHFTRFTIDNIYCNCLLK